MKPLYYNPRQRGNIGTSDTPISGGILQGAISESYVVGYLANNANDKRIRLIRNTGVSDVTYFDTGTDLNGLADVEFAISFRRVGHLWVKIRTIGDAYIKDLMFPFHYETRMLINGEADNDVRIDSVTSWQVAEDIYVLPGLVND